MSTTYTQEQILDMAMEDADTYSEHNGLKLKVSRKTLANWLDLDEWEERFNENDNNAMYDLGEEVADIVRHEGEVITRLEAEVERDGEKYLMTWIPENVSNAYAGYQWAFAFADEGNPPHDGQIHVETGDRQVIAQMAEVDGLEQLSQGYYHLEPIGDNEEL